MMDVQTVMKKPDTGLELLLNTLEADFVGLGQCIVGAGYRLELGGVPAPGMHYNLSGRGRVIISDRLP